MEVGKEVEIDKVRRKYVEYRRERKVEGWFEVIKRYEDEQDMSFYESRNDERGIYDL